MSKKVLMWIGCGAMVLAGVYFLWSRGYQNMIGYVTLLLCPLSHVLMHRAHGHDPQGSTTSAASDEKKACH
ncbi:MAG TPA: DUF2933 domain-containing protein [Symbiobacteriaceae bacterium]|nr:DUF2933 domain-containing protein [Symbiobacteriaceae bacterium]